MTVENKINEPEENGNEEFWNLDDNVLDPDIEAYVQLNKELDELSECLDKLEQRNDSLHEEIIKLLEESKQIRSEIKKSE